MMTKTILTATALCAALLLTACGEKKKSNDIIAPRLAKAEPKAPVRMEPYNDERDVPWIGKTYHVAVLRQPSDSLPMVKDDTGQQFVDNVFTVTVSRTDGSVFFKRHFTKASFASHLNDDYRQTGVLEGIVFDRVDGDWLVFAASVGHPQTDEYIPLVIRLSRMGVLDVSQDTQLDTAPVDESALDSMGDDDGV